MMTGHSHYYHHRRRPASHRSLNEALPPQEPTPYPGLTPYSGFPDNNAAFNPYNNSFPAVGPQQGVEATASALAPAGNSNGGGLGSLLGGGGSSGGSGGLGGLLSNLGLNNINDLKGIIDRMGGIDGIVNNIGKVQKVMQGLQQVAPMVSLLAGMFKKKKGGQNFSDLSSGKYEYTPPRRRSSGKRRSGSRKSGGSARRKRRR